MEDHPALVVACPYCKAKPGKPCTAKAHNMTAPMDRDFAHLHREEAFNEIK